MLPTIFLLCTFDFTFEFCNLCPCSSSVFLFFVFNLFATLFVIFAFQISFAIRFLIF